MRFLNPTECADSYGHLLPLDEHRRPTRELDCLLWVTDWGIFPSNENLHAYYRIRQSYGDYRLLCEAPGHLCLDYERPEVVTLIQHCILFGWDVHLIPTAGFGRAFVSHDEYVELGFADQVQFEETRAAFGTAKLKVSVL
jgi:hypothetical protein